MYRAIDFERRFGCLDDEEISSCCDAKLLAGESEGAAVLCLMQSFCERRFFFSKTG